MSRSSRHMPMIGVSLAKSEATDKRIWHGRLRMAERVYLARQDWETPAPHPYECSDPWTMAKDGRQWIGRRWPGLLRK